MELEIFKKHLSKFLKLKHTQEMLNYFHHGLNHQAPLVDIYGWENWLKMEFLHYLANIDPAGDYFDEDGCAIDRKSKHGRKRGHAFVDIVYRESGTSRDQYHAIELKVRKAPSSLIPRMLKDLRKILSIAPGSFGYRSVTSVGVCSDTTGKKSKWINVVEKAGFPLLEIGPFRWVILHWECERISSDSRTKLKELRYWLKSIEDHVIAQS